jgi:hypothetical protein
MISAYIKPYMAANHLFVTAYAILNCSGPTYQVHHNDLYQQLNCLR